MNKYLPIIIFQMLLTINLFGQLNLSVERQIPTVKENVIKYPLVIVPNSLDDKFTKLQIAEVSKSKYRYYSDHFKVFFQKNPFFRIAEYFDTRIIENQDGTFTARTISHPAFYSALIIQNRIYIFTGSDIETDTQIFNIFLKDAKLKIENKKKAEKLVNLYFAVTRGYFENEGKLILSKIEDVSLSYRKNKESETERLKKIVNSPKIQIVDGNYQVELYTWEIGLGEVKKWSFIIQPNVQIKAQSEIIGKL